jgi:hypothetical protein
MEMNVEKTKVIRISRQPSPVQIITDQKQLQNVEYFKYTCSLITNDARCTPEIESIIAIAKAEFNNKKILFTSESDLNLRKKLVKYYIWSTTLYGAETWTFRKVDQKYLESFEVWCWRRVEKTIWTDSVKNEEVLHRVRKERNSLYTVKKSKAE